MPFQIGDVLSVPLIAHTRHFFVYIGDGEIVEWGPWDGISLMGGKGSVSQTKLARKDGVFQYLSSQGVLQEITLERHTGASKEALFERINQMRKGIDYHVLHCNCEHFACYITGVPIRSEQSAWHLFTEQEPFTNKSMISNLDQLRDALLKCRYCGPSVLTRTDFMAAAFVRKLDDGFCVYHYNHPLGGQHIYVSPVHKGDDFDESYHSIVLAY